MGSPGFIYFATTGNNLTKVGRFAERLTIADKERQYKTLDPAFRICHAYAVDDAVNEEALVLSQLRAHLKVVGGTAFEGAGRENFAIPVAEAIKACATKTPAGLEQTARSLIRGMQIEGRKTVGDLLDEMNANKRNRAIGKLVTCSERNFDIREKLRAVGVMTIAADPDQELAVEVYGTVYKPEKLVKLFPTLRNFKSVLPGLDL